MKIISLYQPYASLMMWRLKRNETRGWSTKYRGGLGIHATLSKPAWCREKCQKEAPFIRALETHGVTFNDLPRGCIIGSVNLINVIPTTQYLKEQSCDIPGFYTASVLDEIAFGDYSGGRFAWVTDNVQEFVEPIPAKGFQGFWNYELNHLPLIKQ